MPESRSRETTSGATERISRSGDAETAGTRTDREAGSEADSETLPMTTAMTTRPMATVLVQRDDWAYDTVPRSRNRTVFIGSDTLVTYFLDAS